LRHGETIHAESSQHRRLLREPLVEAGNLPKEYLMAALSYNHGASDIPLLGETIGENLRRTVERFDNCEALVVRAQEYRASYRELWDLTTKLAKALLASGIRKGDRVGIWSPNRFEWVVVQYATARIRP
jgi:fatty-acyl-CoA synthase